jgi:hypothetical protein
LSAADRPSQAGGFIMAATGAVLFSAKAVIVIAYRHGVDPVTLIAMRMLVALSFFVAAAWWIGRRSPIEWRPGDRARVYVLGRSRRSRWRRCCSANPFPARRCPVRWWCLRVSSPLHDKHGESDNGSWHFR